MKISTLPNPLKLGKTALTTAKRLQKTASVAGLSALRVATGEKPDAYLLKETFERLGVTYIKLGQFIASTPSLFPKEYVIAFADCLDNTTPISFDKVQAVLDDEFASVGGAKRVFADIDPTPLASASIAQVHKGVLLTGETVAIKIQKPNVDTVIATDLGVLHGTFWTLEKVAPSFKLANLAPIVHEIKTRMMAETDFLAEKEHLKKFSQFLQKSGNTLATAPQVYEHACTKKVLTMEFFDGVSLVDEATFGKIANPQELMAHILDTWFLSLMMTGEFHADLHAGNLLLLKDGRVAFLDFGLVGHINPKSLHACMMLTQALQHSDHLATANAMIDIGMTHEREKMAVETLADDLKNLLGQAPKATDPTSLNALMSDLVEIGKRHGIHFPRDFALLTKQLLYFDRFMTTLAPEMDMFSDGRLQFIQGK